MADDPDPGTGVLDGRAWRAFCERLIRLGDALLEPGYPGDERARTEGFRHLATQTAGWLNWAVGHADPGFPAFFRQNDLVMCWGGPNVDQTTRRARVEATGSYRVAGAMGACEDFILTLKNGDMHRQKYGILAEVMASELGFGPGDQVSIVIAAEPHDGVWVPLPADATMLNLREYYWDWQPAAPALFTIQRLDTLGTAPAPLVPAAFADQLTEAAELVEASLPYWNEWVETERAKVPSNTFGPPQGSAGGSSRIRYSFGFYDLAPDEALLIEADTAGARFWDVQQYSLGWFESLDFANRTTSLNHTQSHLDTDGWFRGGVAATDPGIPNWLDSEGRRQAMVTFRWIQVTGEPTIRATVVPLTELAARLPAGTPTVTAHERADQIRRRQAHVAWRYRT